MNEAEFSEVVKAVCKRPRMFTPYGTLAEVIAYLEGYSLAARVQPHSHWGMSRFYQWLKQQPGNPEKAVRWEELLDCHNTSEAELSRFAESYDAFVQNISLSKTNRQMVQDRELENGDA